MNALILTKDVCDGKSQIVENWCIFLISALIIVFCHK